MNFKVGDVINYGMYKNIKISGQDDVHFVLEDKSCNHKKVFKDLVNDNGKYVTPPKPKLPTEKEIDNYARHCKTVLSREFANSKATLKDLRLLVKCKYLGDWTAMQSTQLYTKQSVEYCRSLEIFSSSIKN